MLNHQKKAIMLRIAVLSMQAMAKRPVPDRPAKKAAGTAASALPFGGGVMRSSNGGKDTGEGRALLGSAGGSMRGSLSSIPAAIDLRGMSGLHSIRSSHRSAPASGHQAATKGKPSAGGLLNACSSEWRSPAM